jgi:hypothetical protein
MSLTVTEAEEGAVIIEEALRQARRHYEEREPGEPGEPERTGAPA